MTATVLPPAVALLVGALHGAFDVSDRTQMSSRVAVPGEATPVDLETGLGAALSLSGGSASLVVGYAPALTRMDAFNERLRTTTVMHTGFLNASLTMPRYRLSLSQTGSLGSQSFARLVTAPADPGARADPTAARVDFIPPAQQTVETAGLSTGASGQYLWSRRWRSGLAASYSVWGGRGDARAVLPQQKTASVEVSTGYDPALGETVDLALGADDIRTSNGSGEGVDYLALRAEAGWTRTLGRGASLFLEAGLVGGRLDREGSEGGRTTLIFPTASASLGVPLLRRRGVEVALAWGAAVAPQVTSLNGEVQQRVQGATTLSARLFERTTLAATCDVVQTLPLDDPREARIVGAGLNASHKLVALIDLNAGYRTAWQQSRDPLVGSLPRQWYAYVGVTLRAPQVKF